jgi:hypothetical protein
VSRPALLRGSCRNLHTLRVAGSEVSDPAQQCMEHNGRSTRCVRTVINGGGAAVHSSESARYSSRCRKLGSAIIFQPCTHANTPQHHGSSTALRNTSARLCLLPRKRSEIPGMKWGDCPRRALGWDRRWSGHAPLFVIRAGRALWCDWIIVYSCVP